MKSLAKLFLWIFLAGWISTCRAADRIPLRVEQFVPGAPVTVGVPFPKGALYSPDQVRLLDATGREVPAQVTEVSTWEPADRSIKWIWVFFFTKGGPDYTLEYGEEVQRAPIEGPRIRVKNPQRPGELAEVDTGPLKFFIKKGEGGFLDAVLLDVEGNGFDGRDTLAETPAGRGSFLDILDDAGIDPSRAVITRSVKEKGSGPLHAILRLEGAYRYERGDNVASPFIIRIHAYAGQSYIRVFHTLTYTGTPDKHIPREGQHRDIATRLGPVIEPKEGVGDPGWTEPDDRIAAAGLGLKCRMADDRDYRAGYLPGRWWEKGEGQMAEGPADVGELLSVRQTGPKPTRIPPVPSSTADRRLDGFEALIQADGREVIKVERAEGWLDIVDDRWGVALGIRHFLEEYPKEIRVEEEKAVAYLWSPEAGPMSFARWSDQPDSGMTGNFATGLTKTSELVYYFHRAATATQKVRRTLRYILDPPVAHADPSWYAASEVYGRFSPRAESFPEYERGLSYRFDWVLFNQHYEPWYGMFDYGDHKYFYFEEDWFRWLGNEPAVDYMLWLQFMRTGDRKYFLAAEAMSRHTMDVDNVHWPTDPPYIGDSNSAIDYWKHRAEPSRATPYLGIGRRHARQHWNALLSAHVWLQGWLASYYLTGYHRGLDNARLTAETYTKRIWGTHGLTGRRLYLSVWNMAEVWDATKDPRYFEDLHDRVYRMICLQRGPDQYNSLVIDRYGYAQVYVSQGLYKYYQITGDEEVARALVKHARAVRDNPPWNHAYESFLSTIHSLIVGYELSGEPSFLEEAIRRAEVLKTEQLPGPLEGLGNQKEMAEALLKVSRLPPDPNYHEGDGRGFTLWEITQGLRVFGWTHIYNVPWLLYWLRENDKE